MAILGNLPEAAGPVLCASTLLSLRKDASGGVRPVAIRDTLRRLIGKCLLATGTAKGALARLQPIQCGVGVPNACEMVVMGIQQFVEASQRDGDWIVLKVDVT